MLGNKVLLLERQLWHEVWSGYEGLWHALKESAVSNTVLCTARVVETGSSTLFSENLLFLGLIGRPTSFGEDSGNTPMTPSTNLFSPRKDTTICYWRANTPSQENTGKHKAFSVSLCYYSVLLTGIIHSMLSRSLELLDTHCTAFTCAYAASLVIAARMGNSIVPSVVSRENKAAPTVWKLGGTQHDKLSMLTQAQKPKPRALSIPAGGFWASINLSDLFTAQINWSSELLKLKSWTRINRTICDKPYPQFLSKAEHLQATPGCWEKVCHFIPSPLNKKLLTHSWQCCTREQDMKHSYILKDRALQSILFRPCRRTRHRKDLPEMSSKAGTGSPINYNSLNPKWLSTLLGPEGEQFVHQHREEEGKNHNTKIIHTVALLKTKYDIIFVQKPGIQGAITKSHERAGSYIPGKVLQTGTWF